MKYTAEQVEQLKRDQLTASKSLQNQHRAFVASVSPLLSSEKAKEYLLHGVGRRMKILARCLDKVFEIFPVDREEPLGFDQVVDLEIHLHAFVINVNGLLDNLAWVYILQRNLLDAVGGAHGVGLFREATRAHLPDEIREYVTSERMRDWHLQYAKDYRDALAHRIPLYVPPAAIDPQDAERHRQLDHEMFQALIKGDVELADQKKKEQGALESVCLTAVHSYSDARMVWIHPQMIADANTVLAIAEKFLRHLAAQSN